MGTTIAPELLRSCQRELRVGWGAWLLGRARRRTLADRIEQVLGDIEARPAYSDVGDAVKLRFAADPTVRIPTDPLMRIDRDGIWIIALVRPGTGADVDWAASLAKVPTVAREVFLLHRAGGMDYESIGRRLGISVASVEAHLASALAILDAESMKVRT